MLAHIEMFASDGRVRPFANVRQEPKKAYKIASVYMVV
jgi:hypothetical protein